MKIAAIKPVRHQDRVDIDVTFEDGTACTYIPGKPGDILSGIVSGETLTEERRQLAARAAEKWISENKAVIDEILAR
jgi:hypothetical protein